MHDPASNPAAFLGAELRRARVAAGCTSQEALAARPGYDRTVIAKAETGERPPTPDVADALEAELFAGGPSGLVGRLAPRRPGGESSRRTPTPWTARSSANTRPPSTTASNGRRNGSRKPGMRDRIPLHLGRDPQLEQS